MDSVGPVEGGNFELGGLRVEPSSGQIKGPSGVEQVDPRVMEVLVVLAERAGELVSREELLDRIWPDRIVTEDVVSRCIYQLRRHFARAGGTSRHKSLVETLPKRGYRLTEAVEPATSSSHASPEAGHGVPRRTRQLLLLALLAVLTGTWAWWAPQGREAVLPQDSPRTIAVLPFVDLSADGSQEFLAEGISDELIAVLGEMPELRLISRSSSFSFKGQNLDIATIAERIGASHVLEGSVRTDGDRVRVSAQLVDTANAVHLWSQTFESRLGEVFVIQDEIAAAVASALQLTFDSAGRENGPYRPDTEAHAEAMLGRFLLNRRGSGDLQRAVGLFEQATARDPDFAKAWSGLASAWFFLAFDQREIPYAEGLERMREAAEQALAIDPTQPEALLRMGQSVQREQGFEAARRYFDKAFQHGRNDPEILAFAAGFATRGGGVERFEESARLYRQALALDPLNVAWRSNLALTLLRVGRLDEAAQEASAALELAGEGSGQDSLRRTLIEIRLLQGDVSAAEELLAQIRDHRHHHFCRALIHSFRGQSALAAEAAGMLVNGDEPHDLLEAAELYAHLGNPEAAIDSLGRLEALLHSQEWAYEKHRLLGMAQNSWHLSRLEDDSRWAAFVADVGGERVSPTLRSR